MRKPSRGEIWLVNLDPTTGHEQAKRRPCLILSTNQFNHGASGLAIVVPLTSKNKQNPLHILVNPPDGGLSVSSFLLPEQIRAVSLERFSGNSLGKVNQLTLQILEDMLKDLLEFE